MIRQIKLGNIQIIYTDAGNNESYNIIQSGDQVDTQHMYGRDEEMPPESRTHGLDQTRKSRNELWIQF